MEDVVMFKRIKTIGLTLVGLLAMLGTKAEAHYYYYNGYWYYDSVGCDVTIGSLPTTPDPLDVVCVVTTTQVEALCPLPQPHVVSLSIQVILSAQQHLVPAPGQAQAHVQVVVSDTPLLSNPDILAACSNSTPTAVLIRKLASTVTIQCEGPSSSCLAPLLTTSTATATCTFPLVDAHGNPYDLLTNPPQSGTKYISADVTHVN
jgi:hypothetical protein